MKELIEERIVSLGVAQEKMVETVDIMEKIENSKQLIEKNAYESMNATDKAMNLSNEGLNLINQLKNLCNSHSADPDDNDHNNMNNLVEHLYQVVNKIKDTTSAEITTIHTIEKEIAFYGSLTNQLIDKMEVVSESILEAAACAEFVLAMEI